MFACGRSSAVLWSNPSPMIAQSETYCGDQATGHTNVQHKQKAQHAPKLHNMGWLWAHRPFTSGAILSIWRHDICAEMGLRLLPLLLSAEYNGIGVRVIHICPSLRKYRQKKTTDAQKGLPQQQLGVISPGHHGALDPRSTSAGYVASNSTIVTACF